MSRATPAAAPAAGRRHGSRLGHRRLRSGGRHIGEQRHAAADRLGPVSDRHGAGQPDRSGAVARCGQPDQPHQRDSRVGRDQRRRHRQRQLEHRSDRTIVGTKSFEVAGTLVSSQVPSVKVGTAAGVQVDGVDGTIEGTVSQVGPVQSSRLGLHIPARGRTAVVGHGAVLGFDCRRRHIHGRGLQCRGGPDLRRAVVGTRSYVTVLSNGTLTRKVIKVGMVGDTYTQVLSGLAPGQSVVLVDYAEVVPSSNTNTYGGLTASTAAAASAAAPSASGSSAGAVAAWAAPASAAEPGTTSPGARSAGRRVLQAVSTTVIPCRPSVSIR